MASSPKVHALEHFATTIRPTLIISMMHMISAFAHASHICIYLDMMFDTCKIRRAMLMTDWVVSWHSDMRYNQPQTVYVMTTVPFAWCVVCSADCWFCSYSRVRCVYLMALVI